ncbi:MAG: exodeoxyribonuclease VII large subunit [Holosporaceae bacterium]|jgi:exodeoxyribonuclease VII large subunit|nr:exodeoxyribonuclease VII large subunit [Holosporaceae bacterium]
MVKLPLELERLEFDRAMESEKEEYTVSRLSALIRKAVEQNFSDIKLKAEVSALKEHSSGHLYFTLKDADAVIDAVCWKGVAQKQKIKLENGIEIRCIGQVSTYPMRSKYQFIVEKFELAGVGELLKLLEDRKKKLAEEGLFDPSRRKPIPLLPKLIGIITSPTGSVIKDILHRIRQRHPRKILLWPVLVQGSEASEQVVKAIVGMNSLAVEQRPDVLIIARGGGSFEDLMPFNEESVVRAVALSEIPIISAVGHETDVTLIDYAADLRAPTPTAAAEFAVPERLKLKIDVNKVFDKLNIVVSGNLEKKRLFLNSNKILNIQSIILEKIQRMDHIFDKMTSEISNCLLHRKVSLAKIVIQKPIPKENVTTAWQKLHYTFFELFEKNKNNFTIVSSFIEANSYTKILSKGFAFVEAEKSIPITSAKDAEKFSSFNLFFADGKLKVQHSPSQIDLF